MHSTRSRDASPARSGVGNAKIAFVVIAEGRLVLVADDLPKIVKAAAVIAFALAIQEGENEPQRQRRPYRSSVALVHNLVERTECLEDEVITVESHSGVVELKQNIEQVIVEVSCPCLHAERHMRGLMA